MAASGSVPTLKRAVTMTWSSCDGVDVLDAVDALDDGLQRLGDQLHGVRRAFRPSARTMMSTIGTLICGSSSRGMVTRASRPTAMAATGTAASAARR